MGTGHLKKLGGPSCLRAHRIWKTGPNSTWGQVIWKTGEVHLISGYTSSENLSSWTFRCGHHRGLFTLHKTNENCKFVFYYNKTDITFTVLDGRNEITLADWPNDKHIICNINNDIPVRIPSHLYVLVNRSVLCNCGIEAEHNFLLESLAACHDTNSKLVIYFMVNTAFVNYLDQIVNLTENLNVPILKNKTTFQQTLPISLNTFKFDSE